MLSINATRPSASTWGVHFSATHAQGAKEKTKNPHAHVHGPHCNHSQASVTTATEVATPHVHGPHCGHQHAFHQAPSNAAPEKNLSRLPHMIRRFFNRVAQWFREFLTGLWQDFKPNRLK